MPKTIHFVDPKQRALKTIEVSKVELIGEVWTARHIAATNHQSGHRTEFEMRDIDKAVAIEPAIFEAQRLSRGLASSNTK